MKRLVIGIVGFTILATALVANVGITFAHPDETKQRLLLNYWPQYLCAGLAGLVGGMLVLAANDASLWRKRGFVAKLSEWQTFRCIPGSFVAESDYAGNAGLSRKRQSNRL